MAGSQIPHEILLEEITGKSREYILAHPETEKNLTKKQKARFSFMKKQLSKGVPLAYVLGHKWFFNYKLFVNKDVLIPRPETETLVEEAILWAKENNPEYIFDVGTGTGAIAISLAYVFKKKRVIGSDISDKALAIAKKNMKSSKLKNLNFVKGSLTLPLEPFFKKSKMRNILLCSNLPYLSKKQLREKTIVFEPKLALYGGKSNFEKIGKLLKQIANLQRKYGNLKNSAVFLEMNYNHASIAKKAIKKYLPNARAEMFKDLSGFTRFAKILF